ncbi:MAG: hypothetical protein ACK47B_23725 [Armatimonadota bacterium]
MSASDYALRQAVTGLASSSDYNANLQDLEDSLLEGLGAGVLSGGNVTDGGGLVASVDATELLIGIYFAKAAASVALSPSATNKLWAVVDPDHAERCTYEARTDGTTPARAALLAEIVTGAASITSIDDNPAGRNDLIALAALADEILAARGSLSSLPARLAVALEDNGALKANSVGSSQIADGAVTDAKFSGQLSVAKGGTGAATAAAARTALGAAASGANGDITSLTNLTGGAAGSGDLNMGGGYRMLLEGWYADNPLGSSVDDMNRFGAGAAFPKKALMPRAGSVTAVAVKSNEARTAGTLTVTVYKNGAATALTAVLDGTNTTWKVTTAAKDVLAFAAGDELSVRVDCSPDWAPTTADIRVVLEVEM